MDKNSIYLPLISTKNASTVTDEKWDEAMSYYKNGEWHKIVPTIIEYINADLVKYRNDKGYTIPHGSVTLEITLTDTEFKVICPFIDISEAKKTPLMRKIAELRLNPLDLTNITINQDKARFEYTCPLELCEPHKVYDLLKEICLFADTYDDEFIEKYNAKNVHEPKIEQIDDLVKEQAYKNFQHVIEDNINRLDYYISKRDGRKAWCTLNIALKQLEFFAQPQGFLRTEIERYIDYIYNRDVQFHDLILKSKENLLKLKNYDTEKFKQNLYTIEIFVPYKYTGKKENIRENWTEIYADIKEMINHNDHEAASIEMLNCYYNLFYYNNVNNSISKPIMHAMEEASEKSWAEASETLLKGMKYVMEDDSESSGFGMDISEMMKEQMKNSMSMIQKMMKNFSN